MWCTVCRGSPCARFSPPSCSRWSCRPRPRPAWSRACPGRAARLEPLALVGAGPRAVRHARRPLGGGGSVDYRTRSATGRWRPWRTADDESRSGAWHDCDLDWTGRSRAVRFRVHGDVRRLRELRARLAGARETGTGDRGGRHPGDRHAPGLARERGDRARAAVDRLAHPPRDRPPHGRDEQLHACTGCGDRARDRGVPRAGERVERHRLQLSRRPVRHRVRGPRRGCRAQRRSARTPRGSTSARSVLR